MLSCVCRALSLVSTAYQESSTQVRRLQRACKKNALVAWVAHKAGMQCSIRSSSLSTVPYSMKNSITYFQLSPDVQQSIAIPCILLEKWEFTTVSQYHSITAVLETYGKVVNLLLHYSVTRMRYCCSQLHCIELNVPGTDFGTKWLREKNALLQNRTRSNLTQSVFATT